MKLAVSNIAWTNEEEKDVARILQDNGVHYVEVAPSKLWSGPDVPSPKDIRAYKTFWEKHGIEIVAFQSMLFNRPDLKIFKSPENRRKTEEYLKQYIILAKNMEVGTMVFGSPKNRQRGTIEGRKATKIAQEFFELIGNFASENNVMFCIEPNAEAYKCDFITNTRQGLTLVQSVHSPGFGLHLDTACMSLANDDMSASINAAASILKHFHISSPMLEQVEYRKDVDHAAAAKALRDINYDKYVSIEMKPAVAGLNADRVRKAVRFAQEIYR